MDYLTNLFKKSNMAQLMLVILFLMYLLMGFQTPEAIANIVDTTFGKIIVVLFALFLFVYSNPILGVLGVLVAFQLIRSASQKTGLAALEKYYPTEEKKWSPFSPRHQFPYTLEQEVVKKMTNTQFNTNFVKASFRPVLDNTHDASYLKDM
jgi:hypothetical protein